MCCFLEVFFSDDSHVPCCSTRVQDESQTANSRRRGVVSNGVQSGQREESGINALESQVKHCTGRKPVSSLPLQIYTCIHSYVEFFHASIIKPFSISMRRPSFPALLSSGRNKTRKEGKELSFLSFQLLTYFPLTKNLQFLFLLFFFFSYNWSAANGTSRQVNRRS